MAEGGGLLNRFFRGFSAISFHSFKLFDFTVLL